MAELLQYLYHLFGVQLDETKPDESELSHTVEDSDSEAAEDQRNFRDFLTFEAKKPLLDGLLLRESEVPPSEKEVIGEGIKSQLEYFNEQLPELLQEARCRPAPAPQLTWILAAY